MVGLLLFNISTEKLTEFILIIRGYRVLAETLCTEDPDRADV